MAHIPTMIDNLKVIDLWLSDKFTSTSNERLYLQSVIDDLIQLNNKQNQDRSTMSKILIPLRGAEATAAKIRAWEQQQRIEASMPPKYVATITGDKLTLEKRSDVEWGIVINSLLEDLTNDGLENI